MPIVGDSYDISDMNFGELGFDIQSIISKLTGGGSSSSGSSSGSGNFLTKIESFLMPSSSSSTTPTVLPAPSPSLAPATEDTGPGLLTWVLLGGSIMVAIGVGVYYYKKGR